MSQALSLGPGIPPQAAGAPESPGLLDRLLQRATPFGTSLALSRISGKQRDEITYAALHERSRALSDHLIERGFPPGERIAILSESRPEWAVAFLGGMRAGAVLVPLDPKLQFEELAGIVADARPRRIFVSSRLADAGLRLASMVPTVEEVACLDPGPGSGLPWVGTLGASSPRDAPAREMKDTVLLVYTSGTTGRPKGVQLSYASLVFEVQSLYGQIPMGPGDVFLSMLPLNHLLELTCGLLSQLFSGAEVCYGDTLLPGEMARTMAEKRVTKMVTVPLFLKLLKGEIERAVRGQGLRTRLGFAAARILARCVTSDATRRRLFRSIHERLGGRLQCFIVGGSALDAETEGFFEGIGIAVCQGYGMTECGPVIAVNALGARRRGSVGRPLPGVEVRIQDGGRGGEGEIQTRGPHLMQGYTGGEASGIDADGWLHTGDVGRLDEDGYLYVTGRIKNLIVLASGKKVQPEEVEEALGRSGMLREVCVLGGRACQGLLAGTEEVCAVVVPGDGLQASPEAVRREVDRVAAALSPHKRPSRVVVHPGPLPRSMAHKIRRQRVLAWLEGQDRP